MPLQGRTGAGADFAATNTLLTSIEINTLAKNHRANIGFSVEARNGDIPGCTVISLTARNPIADNDGERVMFPYDATDDPPDVTEIVGARTLSFASSSIEDGAGGSTGTTTLLINGLDANFDAQTENITMNGQSAVNSANTYVAINQMFSLVVGTTGHNVGNIYCSDSTDTFSAGATPIGVPNLRNYHVIEKLWNVSFTGIYTVPRNHVWIPVKYSSISSGSASKFAISQIDARLAFGLPIFRLNEFTNAGLDFNFDLNGIPPVGEKGVWILRGESSTTQTVSILAYAQAALIDLALYNV